MKKLNSYITSDYFSAANSLKGKTARKRIVAYVESYDDVLFWRMALSEYEDDTRYFEVMLPSRRNLNKGKKSALLQLMRAHSLPQNSTLQTNSQLSSPNSQLKTFGPSMLACVDADYDYLMQGKTPLSEYILNNPYVIHTYVYAIENYQCYAPSLHNVCVMATLNDHAIFDFKKFLSEYSRIIFPLFVWSIMLYRSGEYNHFCITDFNSVVTLKHSRMENIMPSLEKLHNKVKMKVHELQRKMPGKKAEYLATRDGILQLGVTPETTYLFVQGHHLFDNIVVPALQMVCDELRRERETEIKKKAHHAIQMQNEMSAYTHSQSDIAQMLKKNQGYFTSPIYRKLQADIEKALQNEATTDNHDVCHQHVGSVSNNILLQA